MRRINKEIKVKAWDEHKVSSFTKVQKIVSQNVADSTLSAQLFENKFITALYLSQLAYFKFPSISAKLSELGATRISLYTNDKGCQGYFAELHDMAVVAFRGTQLNKTDDLQSALTFWKQSFKELGVHKGFIRSFEDMLPEVIGDLQRVAPTKRIIYTGHSMGGALATLLSIAHKPHELCTFGAPKVSDKNLREHLEGIEFNRIVTSHDWIPSLPPSIPYILPYNHVGTKYVFPVEWSWRDIIKPHLLVTYLQAILAHHEESNPE